MNRRVVRDMLNVAGVSVAEADGGEEGLRLIDANDYDVVLLDLRMPGMDGFAVLQHLRGRTDAKAELPVVVVTAEAGPGLREECLEAGADSVMFKPVAMERLFDSMGEAIVKRGGGMIG